MKNLIQRLYSTDLKQDPIDFGARLLLLPGWCYCLEKTNKKIEKEINCEGITEKVLGYIAPTIFESIKLGTYAYLTEQIIKYFSNF